MTYLTPSLVELGPVSRVVLGDDIVRADSGEGPDLKPADMVAGLDD